MPGLKMFGALKISGLGFSLGALRAYTKFLHHVLWRWETFLIFMKSLKDVFFRGFRGLQSQTLGLCCCVCPGVNIGFP